MLDLRPKRAACPTCGRTGISLIHGAGRITLRRHKARGEWCPNKEPAEPWEWNAGQRALGAGKDASLEQLRRLMTRVPTPDDARYVRQAMYHSEANLIIEEACERDPKWAALIIAILVMLLVFAFFVDLRAPSADEHPERPHVEEAS